MKFLCVRCDEAMRLERVGEPEDGSLSVVFACTACGNRIAMLTNPWETQLVRALDVKIGGQPSPSGPMEFVRSMLASGREAGPDAASSSAAPSRCPFSAMANMAAERPGLDEEQGNRGIGDSGQSGQSPGWSNPQVAWSPEATRRLERIPESIRPMARQGIERIAAQRGYHRITEAIMDEVRDALGL